MGLVWLRLRILRYRMPERVWFLQRRQLLSFHFLCSAILVCAVQLQETIFN
jgi:hypothetical protein